MTLGTISSYVNSFIDWSGFASAETYLKNNPYVKLQRGALDLEIIELINQQNLPANTDQGSSLLVPVVPISNPGTIEAGVHTIAINTPVSPLFTPTPPPLLIGATLVPVGVDPTTISTYLPKFPPTPPSPPIPWATLFKLGAIATLASKLAGNILPLIPPFLYKLYTSEVRVLQNFDICNIQATETPRVYSIGMGNKYGKEIKLDFEVVAGKFYKKEVVEIPRDFNQIFQSTSWMSYAPILNKFEWKRQSYKTNCNIFVDDPGNPSLQNGPVLVNYIFSKNECFNIIYRDPKAKTELTYDNYENAETSEFKKFNGAVLTVDPLGKFEREHSRTTYINFERAPHHGNDYYLRVSRSLKV